MQLITVAAAVLNQTPLDWDGNKRNILRAIELAREAGVSVLCLPELCVPGYGCEDAFHSPANHRMCLRVLEEVLPHTRDLILCLGLPVLHHNGVFNTACTIVDGAIAGFTAKQHLAGDGIHYEPRWFKPWPAGVQGEIEVGGVPCPIGDLFFDCSGVRIGYEICEDAWAAQRPGRTLAARAVDIILNPSASHFAFGKNEVRKRFLIEGSRAFGVTYVYANLVGNEAGRAIYDGGALIASGGELIVEGPRFSYEDVGLTTAAVDLEKTRMGRARLASHHPPRPTGRRLPDRGPVHVSGRCLLLPHPAFPPPEAWPAGADVKEEEFSRAIALALFDYLRKSRSHGFVVSISGGADSAAVSVLVSLLTRFGVAELGIERFREKLRHIQALAGAGDSMELVRKLLTCAYQSTRNSSDTTRNAARGVAESIGAEFLELDVDALVQSYVGLIEDALGRKLTWETDDIPLQNIQARVRAPSVWMLANVHNALLLSTSNRSEAAVGYATMDGDTSGSISPIAGIDKAFLRQWLRWMETTGPDGVGPLASLSAINAQAPTAELRPSEAGQTDESDLMPYPVLDAIERAAIRDKLGPVEVFQRMRGQRGRFGDPADAQIGAWVERFFRLWSRNQWKRERYAPSFHVDDENLDPKTWCRFPILSGGFERELRELNHRLRKI